MDSVDFLKNYKFDDESEGPFHFDFQNVFELLDKMKKQEAAISQDSINTMWTKILTTRAPPTDHVGQTTTSQTPPGHTGERTTTSQAPLGHTEERSTTLRTATNDSGEHPTVNSASKEDSKEVSSIPVASNHDPGGTRHNVEGGKDSENHVMTVRPWTSSTTEDYRAALNRFWESTDYNNMNDYIKKLEESIKRYNVLDGTFRGMYSPYKPPAHSQPAPTSPAPTTMWMPAYHAPAPHPPARDNWRDHRDTPIVKHKHGLQTWHIVIIVAILVAALVSYACRVSSKRSMAPRSRRRRCGSAQAQERSLPEPSAPEGDQLYAVPTSRLVADTGGGGAPMPARRADDPHLQLQEVSVERIGFVIPDVAPPSRPDTPPPPYPGPPLRHDAADERHRKAVEPPPPYCTAVTKPR